MSVGHYENFPVASLLMPARLRPAVRAIYRFARTADDIADEGDAKPQERLAQLDALGRQLDAIEDGTPTDWPDLAAAVHRFELPVPLLRDLLSAFAQDVTTQRYRDYAALLDYCRRSANPIGRLLLCLFDVTDDDSLRRSDSVCSALQLVNFWQDVAIDWEKGRVYLPQTELARFGIDDSAIARAQADNDWSALMAAQTELARTMLHAGEPLAHRLRGRIGWELRLVIQGGLRIAERIDAVRGDVFAQRPVLGSRDWLVMVARAATM